MLPGFKKFLSRVSGSWQAIALGLWVWVKGSIRFSVLHFPVFRVGLEYGMPESLVILCPYD